jgi:hypothetical protein
MYVKSADIINTCLSLCLALLVCVSNYISTPLYKFSVSQAAFGITFRDTGGYIGKPEEAPEEGYWKEVHNEQVIS